MTLASDILSSGSKPKRITAYTSGTGTYIPTADMARCLVFVQAAGCNGTASSGGNPGPGGGAGAMVPEMVRVPIAGTAWAVGASGLTPSASNFGFIRAQPAESRTGGLLGNGSVTGGAPPFALSIGGQNGAAGGAGGAGGAAGGAGGAGSAAGFPGGSPASQLPNGTAAGGNAAGGGGGGDSYFGSGGKGGQTGALNGANATGYGSGGGGGGGNSGGAGGLGKGGYIEIWDFGA